MKGIRKPPLSERYTILKCFSRLCEYMYRKGVADSAELYSEELTRKFLTENDVKKDFKFVFDEDGRPMRLELYCSVLSMFLIRIGARAGATLLDGVKVSKRMQMGAAALANAYYRKGLNDGIGMDLRVAKDYYYEDDRFISHKKLNGEKFTFLDFYQDMQMEALRLDIEEEGHGYKIWRFICDALQEYYARLSD